MGVCQRGRLRESIVPNGVAVDGVLRGEATHDAAGCAPVQLGSCESPLEKLPFYLTSGSEPLPKRGGFATLLSR